MNSLEQILRRQIRRKDEQIKSLLFLLDRASNEVDTLSSLGCAFAFDLAVCDEGKPSVANQVRGRWEGAIAELLEEVNK